MPRRNRRQRHDAGRSVKGRVEIFLTIRMSEKYYDWLWLELKKCGYIQSDETTLRVIHDGRKAGRLSYMWVHMTSELCDDVNPIVLFSYEMTRAADHLREYFGD